MTNVYLRVPTKEEVLYRAHWLRDPLTMSYNAGLDLAIKGYDKETGTITLTDDEMLTWYQKWASSEPDKYYAYIYTSDFEEPIGEVYYYPEDNSHAMGILISAKHRHKGYAASALLELEKVAFEKNNLFELIDMVPEDRVSAINLFKKVGFTDTNINTTEKFFDKDRVVKKLIITKEIYFKNML